MALSLKQLQGAIDFWLIKDERLGNESPPVDIASGGLQKLGALPPVLYDDQDHAINAWLVTAMEYGRANAGKHFNWVTKPTLDRWQITATDAGHSHRLVSDRFSVFARIVVA
jgi:hypothetical protein